MDKRKRRLLCMLEGSGQKSRWISGVPPLQYSAKKQGTLKNYRIYGNTVGGESVGDLVESGEHAGEYEVSVTVSNGTDTLTTPIYLPEPIKMVGDEAEYIDYGEQKQHRVRKNLFDGEILQGFYSFSNGIYYGSFGSYKQYVCTNKIECKSNTTYTIQVYAPEIISYSYGFVWWDENLNFISSYISTQPQSSDITTFTATAPNNAKYMAFDLGANNAESTIVPSNVSWIMLNKGSTALPYEPYITNTELNVTLPALPTIKGTNEMSVGTAVQPSEIEVKGKIKAI